MNKKTLLYASFVVSTLLSFTTCTELSSLANDADIALFEVDSIYNSNVRIASPLIVDSTSTIEIPLLYGLYEESIFKVTIVPKSSKNKVLNINTDSVAIEKEITLRIDPLTKDTLFVRASNDFYVIAENGYARKWRVLLVGSPRSSKNDILSFDINRFEPTSALVAAKGVINHWENVVKVIIPQRTFPITIYPTIVLSDSSTIVDRKPSDPFTFESSSHVQTIQVQAADGSTPKTWYIAPVLGDNVSDTNIDANSNLLYSVNVDEPSLTATLIDDTAHRLVEIEVDSLGGGSELANADELILRVKRTDGGKLVYPIAARLNFNVRPNSLLIGYHMGDRLLFDKEDRVHSFYLYDSGQDLKKRWRVRLERWINNEANVTDFTMVSMSPTSVLLESYKPEIEQETGKIRFVVTEGVDRFPLTVRYRLKLSSNATCKEFASENDVVTHTFQSAKEVKTFTVVAESGAEKRWSIEFVSAQELNPNAEVESFRVVEYKSKENKVQLDSEVVIDSELGTITLKVLDNSDYFPLQMSVAATTSFRSTFLKGDLNNVLTFNTVSDSYSFTLRSQDEQTTKQWTIRFVDATPDKSTAAELIEFRATNVTAGFTIDNTSIDSFGRVVTLHMSGKGSGSFSFTPRIVVSDGATTSGVQNGVRSTFASLAEQKVMMITAENGKRISWTVRVSYEPQLPNGNMESWSANTPTGWCTPNNAFATMVRKGTAGGNSYAEMKATSVIGNFAAGSIYLGSFKMDISQVSNPKAMSYFGVPFEGRPIAISADIHYTHGAGDKGSIEIHLLNFEGTTIDYHTYGQFINGIYTADATREPGVTVVGQGRYEFESTNGWENISVPVNYTGYPNKAVTHIHVAYCTSYRGDELKGNTNSAMLVDNIVLKY